MHHNPDKENMGNISNLLLGHMGMGGQTLNLNMNTQNNNKLISNNVNTNSSVFTTNYPVGGMPYGVVPHGIPQPMPQPMQPRNVFKAQYNTDNRVLAAQGVGAILGYNSRRSSQGNMAPMNSGTGMGMVGMGTSHTLGMGSHMAGTQVGAHRTHLKVDTSTGEGVESNIHMPLFRGSATATQQGVFTFRRGTGLGDGASRNMMQGGKLRRTGSIMGFNAAESNLPLFLERTNYM